MEFQMVGIIGVGAMGLAVSERLIAAGFPVCGDPRESLNAFSEIGGTALQSAAAVAASANTLILLLPGDFELGQVIEQIRPALRAGQILLCLGTHLVHVKQQAANTASDRRAILLDGDISGTPEMIRAGKACVWVAGDEEASTRAKPVLDGFSNYAAYLGTFGNASKIKLVTNYLVGVHTLAAAEALLFASRLGLAPDKVIDAIAPSAGGSTMLSVRGPMMAERRFGEGNMTSFLRDFEMLRDSLPENGAGGAVLLDVTEQAFRRAIEAGLGSRDISAVYESLSQWSLRAWSLEGHGCRLIAQATRSERPPMI